MKVPVLTALVLLATLGVIRGLRLPDPSWAVLVKPQNIRQSRSSANNDSTLTDDPSADCGGKIFSCASCSVSRVCRPKDDNSVVHYQDSNCPSDRPYCDEVSGSCVKTPILKCGDLKDDFICLEKNHFFPDPDCTKFHYCDEKFIPRSFQCIGEGLVYNAVEMQCLPQSDTNKCGKFQCDGNALKKIKHSNFPRYFAMCKSEANVDAPLVVGVCPPYYEVNPDTQVCEPDCSSHGNGNIPDSKDCTKYYTCTVTELPNKTTYMQRTPKHCPKGQSFDLNLFMCVTDPDGKICKKH